MPIYKDDDDHHHHIDDCDALHDDVHDIDNDDVHDYYVDEKRMKHVKSNPSTNMSNKRDVFKFYILN